ncbi:hypothetical protein KQX54_005866 [Cotesia glomerata]|uniref:Uncharacterized protein n=1 Tax=Cotesia glomerata TaxID=32391 RepID=A0AAV7J4L8_COTGL|nr:hypothetical protein KQX54_005866 [Cotesia glomerata]
MGLTTAGIIANCNISGVVTKRRSGKSKWRKREKEKYDIKNSDEYLKQLLCWGLSRDLIRIGEKELSSSWQPSKIC